MTRSLTLLAFTAALAACTAEQPKGAETATLPDPQAETAADPAEATEGPAGEVPADTREPSEAATPAASLPEGVDAKWAPYYEHGIDFVFGGEAGAAKAAETGKPMMMFYTATW